MAIIDATKGQVTYSGDHFMLAHVLRCAKEDFISLLKEIEDFKPKEAYPNYDPRVAYHLAFSKRIYRQMVSIVLIASVLIEALANMLLLKHADPDTFAVLERANPIEKWITLPKLFISKYDLPKDKELYNQLKLLITRRNAIAHSKPEIKIGNKVIHRGKISKRVNRENKLHLDFCDLPEKLIDNLGKYDEIQAVELKIFFDMLFDQETKDIPK